MIFLMTLLVFIKITITASGGSAGTTIFYNYNGKRKCWTEEDIAKLRARRVFEDLIPLKTDPHEIDGKFIKEELRYFRRALRSVEQFSDPHLVYLLKEALSDTLGAHLRSEILPSVRFAFYAGYIPYRSAKQIHELFDEQKTFLNSQGLGWRAPNKVPIWSNLTVAKILIGSDTLFDSCSTLITKRDSNSCIHIPTPKFDDDLEPTAIALPFKVGGLVSLTSPNANNILLKYYTAASRCILYSSPQKCRHTDFVTFNNEMWHWMKREVAPHLVDENLYPAYAGVLRIAAAVQNYGKGLSRRNLFDNKELYMTKWYPWRKLTQTYLYVNADWTPKIIILVVILIAIAIYSVQVIYNYLCGEASSCRCKGRSTKSHEDVAYTNVESNIPAILPQPQKTVFYASDKNLRSRITSKTKAASVGSMRTPKIYDLANSQKLMDAIESDGKELSSRSSTSEDESEMDDNEDENKDRCKSPPMLETSISQIRIEKTPRLESRNRTPMYSTSTMTRDPYSAPHQVSGTVWSGTESSSSSSTASSTSKSQKSLSSRDLAWTRRAISKNSQKDTTLFTRTELDFSSFTTPPSQH